MSFSRLSFSRVLFGWSLTAVLAVASVEILSQIQARAAEPADEQSSVAAVSSEKIDSSKPTWCMKFNVERFVGSPLAKDVFKLAEIDGSDIPDIANQWEKISKFIGFDPLESIEQITVYGLTSPLLEGKYMIDMKKKQFPEKFMSDSVAVAQLRGSTGNLEGFALTLSEYQSAEYRGATIHSGMFPQHKKKIYMVVRKPEGKTPGFVIIGGREDLVKEAVDLLVLGDNSEQPISDLIIEEAPEAFFTASFKLGDELLQVLPKGLPPQSGLVKMLQSLTVSLGCEKESIVAQLSIELEDEKRAEQFEQLIQGCIAALHLPIEELEKEEELVKMREIIDEMKVTRSGNHVTCQLSRPLEGLLEELQQLGD